MSRPTRAQQYKILVEPPSTLKTHCELMRRLTDKPDTVQESSDNSEQTLFRKNLTLLKPLMASDPAMRLLLRYFLVINFYLTPTLAAGLFEDHKPFYRFSRKQFCPLTAYFFIKVLNFILHLVLRSEFLKTIPCLEKHFFLKAEF